MVKGFHDPFPSSYFMYTEMAFVDSDNNLVVAYHLRKREGEEGKV